MNVLQPMSCNVDGPEREERPKGRGVDVKPGPLADANARAWRLRQASGHRRKDDRPPSAVDALVMAEAVAAGTAVILASDPDDLELLRDAAGLSKDQVEIIGV